MHAILIQSSDEQEETAMLKSDEIDFPLDAVMEVRETYPEEVLDSEWNPVIAQLQLLKRHGWSQELSEASLRIAFPKADFIDRKP
ncbi:MAG: hypothetical protein B6D72_12540 [gamma proteobacterium symbiont of Ctena orbiculata]|uniref:Uncharacterized protein n=1 Tax=Candidatus Thiodiazotropha taylori TaxID=2792791 RepID=A0A944QVC9_9GAMM|nr:hypothetical protein [Candidatus Thiodiazotropha taylori]PUB82061.1 MAG: hypothetical protein DBP00_18200 [gamma proteobacterium symbiont of Ctena orbiculata]MBT2991097.1 hypothetical protein [Candidatus Thiodiazotropha taylori]MBT2998739.1 hypothetical protein [Candidatus Thiodiazotropha taylori]MBT3002344.1 hypothetical protein [Candidatus Thiodiazotropha taylori]